jgi:hypothetical protein
MKDIELPWDRPPYLETMQHTARPALVADLVDAFWALLAAGKLLKSALDIKRPRIMVPHTIRSDRSRETVQ